MEKIQKYLRALCNSSIDGCGVIRAYRASSSRVRGAHPECCVAALLLRPGTRWYMGVPLPRAHGACASRLARTGMMRADRHLTEPDRRKAGLLRN